MKKSIKTKVLSLVASFAMVLSLLVLPIGVHAEENIYQIVGGDTYPTLKDAVNAVGDGGTIQLLANEKNAEGISVPSGKNFTIDFNNHIYTLTEPGAGSLNTETNGFQLLKDSTITFKNGILNISESNKNAVVSDKSKPIKRIIQNYSNLTLENMTIEAKNQYGGEDYVLSFNNGEVHFKGNTNVITSSNNIISFDVCKFNDYPSAKVIFDHDYTGTINGKICFDSPDTQTHQLIINGNGNFESIYFTKEVNMKQAVQIHGGVFNSDISDYVVDDKVCVEVDGKYIVHSHENLTKIDAKKPTCTEKGNIAYYTCDVCGQLFEDEKGMNELTKEVSIPAKGHTSDTGTVTKKPTVDAEGVKTYKCTVCGEVVKTESIAKLPMPKPEEPKLPSVDTSKPVDKVTVGVNDEKSSEVLENVSSNIVKDIIEGKDVKEVATLLVDESKVEEILANAKEVKSEVKVENKTEKEIDKKVIDTIDTKIESTIKENQTFEVAQYLDLSVLLTADGQALAQVNELDKSIQFTVKLPTDLLKANREFFVVRVHNGVATIIEPSHVTEDGVLTFETDAFSTYAIAYVDTKTSGDVTVTPEQPKPTDKEDKPVDTNKPTLKPTEKDETVKTDDENNMMLYASFAGLALIGGAILVLTKKREELMK